MKNSITKRQKELLGFIYKHIEDAGYPPTFEEMKEKLNVSSNQSIIDFLTQLIVNNSSVFFIKQLTFSETITFLFALLL